ncbi:unnamed protein product [Dracunculus medinensis]|uniref:Peptidase M41 FtsH extracellular domain-containing protein n=1 Tax=Dracunculus medinensis TaxID=318479 RepID=A0A3P7STH4_DRAME|nr:unnamed protein product [Dracunculus medinensis]
MNNATEAPHKQCFGSFMMIRINQKFFRTFYHINRTIGRYKCFYIPQFKGDTMFTNDDLTKLLNINMDRNMVFKISSLYNMPKGFEKFMREKLKKTFEKIKKDMEEIEGELESDKNSKSEFENLNQKKRKEALESTKKRIDQPTNPDSSGSSGSFDWQLTSFRDFKMSDKDKGFVFVATVGFLLALYLSNSYEEVSWKKFYSDFLEKGNVERLEVVNNRWVRIIPTQYSTSGTIYYFNIGSVDSFERSITAAQHHLGIDIENHVPVFYKNEFEFWHQLPNIIQFLIPVLIFGPFLYSVFKARGVGGSGNDRIYRA